MLPRLLAAAMLSMLLSSSVNAWGAAGHSIIAELAERQLSAPALREVKRLLGGQKSLASISSWADQIQVLRPETRNWHFVNIPFDAEKYVEERDCKIHGRRRLRDQRHSQSASPAGE